VYKAFSKQSCREENDPSMGGQWQETPRWVAGRIDPPRLYHAGKILGTINKHSANNHGTLREYSALFVAVITCSLLWF
jgi:hypothetical protein